LFIIEGEVRMDYSNGSGKESFHKVGSATWFRDGFVSLHAGSEDGRLLTHAFIPASPELRLNINASQGDPTLRAGDFQDQPLKGWEFDQPSEPIRGDQLSTVVRWSGSDFD
jgi:hypothetical protein